jgi:predicted enzyme related to lactoylglutathione lyase
MGGVVHFEIPADDENRAREFYRTNFGWTFDVVPGMGYSLATTGATGSGDEGAPHGIDGAVFRRDDALKSPVVTIDVPDIDGALDLIGRTGGEIFRGKMEVPGRGWNAYFKDSEGNVIGLWQEARTAAAADDRPGPA